MLILQLCVTYFVAACHSDIHQVEDNQNIHTIQVSVSKSPQVHFRGQLYSNTAMIRDWNAFSQSIRHTLSPLYCKFHVCYFTNHHTPLRYHVESSKTQTLHTRLRLGCSSFNSDLHRKSIIPCPLCRYEDVKQQSTSRSPAANITV